MRWLLRFFNITITIEGFFPWVLKFTFIITKRIKKVKILKTDTYTVGQLAAVCRVSIQTLRYYDKIGLLRPSSKNPENGYRYYSQRDILFLRIIQDLKETGLTLDEIKELLRNDDIGMVMDILQRKKDEFQEMIGKLTAVSRTIDTRLENLGLYLQQNNIHKTFEDLIEIKSLPPRRIAYIRHNSSCHHEALVMRFYELDHLLRRHGLQATGNRMAVYHDFLLDFSPEDCDLEVCVPILDDAPQTSTGLTRMIPGGLYATVIFHGEYAGQCNALIQWIREHHYEITGPGIEIYINSFMNTRFPKNYLTEVQFPIKKY